MVDQLNIPTGLDWPVVFRQRIQGDTYQFRFRERDVRRDPPSKDTLQKTFRERGPFRKREYSPDSVDKVETYDAENDNLIQNLNPTSVGSNSWEVELDESKYNQNIGYYSLWFRTVDGLQDEIRKPFFAEETRFTVRSNTVTIDIDFKGDPVIKGHPLFIKNPIGFGFNELPVVFFAASTGDEDLRPTKERIQNGDVNIYAEVKDG